MMGSYDPRREKIHSVPRRRRDFSGVSDSIRRAGSLFARVIAPLMVVVGAGYLLGYRTGENDMKIVGAKTDIEYAQPQDSTSTSYTKEYSRILTLFTEDDTTITFTNEGGYSWYDHSGLAIGE